MSTRKSHPPKLERLDKVPTGIAGFDTITQGGLPQGRPTLVCGGAGCGKSLFAAEFLVRGATQFDEPGVLMTFEETAADITKNVASLGFDAVDLVARKKLVIDYVRVERNEIEENGEYDLEGLFIRLEHAIQTIRAKRVVLDTIEALFSGLSNQAILRSELRRLFGWLKERGMTTVITAEKGERTLTRQGLEEYVSDCVILLDHRVTGQISTRRLRVVKYRGSVHGTNEYPFLIDDDGISVFPVTSSHMDYGVSNERISSGIKELDAMLGGRGYYRGSTILLSGTAGTGKTSVAAHLAHETCRRGEKCLFFSFEESPAQLIRNMGSIGLDLKPHLRSKRLCFDSSRPTMHGLEAHLVRMHKLIDQFKPDVVIVDPLSNLRGAGTVEDSATMLIRLFDYLRRFQMTGFFVSLSPGGASVDATDESVSSIVDTWLALRNTEVGGARHRTLYILKSRGMAHSNEIHQLDITSRGVRLDRPATGGVEEPPGAPRKSGRAPAAQNGRLHSRNGK
ncbi:MAG: Circadian clock protein KaiC [Lacunisphaera sp.]|nr:Circadian clock protein KaiC [Lacunisphaera sp.]